MLIFFRGNIFRFKSRNKFVSPILDSPVKFSVCVNEGQDKLPTMYWLPNFHRRPYKAKFIANSSSCTTTELLEKVLQDVYLEYEEKCTHGRLLYVYYALCQAKRLIKTSEPVYAD